jgi:hypothetical protein
VYAIDGGNNRPSSVNDTRHSVGYPKIDSARDEVPTEFSGVTAKPATAIITKVDRIKMIALALLLMICATTPII